MNSGVAACLVLAVAVPTGALLAPRLGVHGV